MQNLSTWRSLESSSNTLQKKFLWRQYLLPPSPRYCCFKVGWYYPLPVEYSEVEKGCIFSKKLKECSVNVEIGWKVILLQASEVFNDLYTFLILFNPFSTGKSKNSISEISIIPQTLNINNKRTTSAKSINLDIVTKLNKNSLKMFLWRQWLLLPFSRYCCSKAGCYFHRPSEVQGAKELNFQWKTKKVFGFC